MLVSKKTIIDGSIDILHNVFLYNTLYTNHQDFIIIIHNIIIHERKFILGEQII